ncbi:hypothetical protein [Aporhodopirellula aestuarii]|uniref:Uncharacterized protein n=1 Tax=Aporhodopirellula aestuarii TaxID=2950107 RepID=A0ABT0TZM5_9BACT|nr:hypothetical protein [Aporhodopirellula aestuarii]MCM2370017.1 hypothetical protein [Aporhodopirellula aestuarii]
MNPTPPAPDQRRTRRYWLSKSRGAASFGRGVRWWFCSIGRVQWSIALSLPLAAISVFLIAMAPSMFGGADHSDTGSWAVHLAFVWCIGLFIQAAITQTLFSVRPPANTINQIHHFPPLPTHLASHSVTLTIGGVWIAIPDIDASPSPEEFVDHEHNSLFADAPEELYLRDNSQTILESFGGASRVLLLWSAVLMSLGVAALICLLFDRFSLYSLPQSAEAGDASDAAIALVDRVWIASAWIFCLQGFWQLLPVPQSLGRVGWSAVIGLFSGAPNDEAGDREKATHAARMARWGIVAFALVTLVGGVMAIHASGISTQAGGRALPAFAGISLLAVWLFASTRGEDLFASQMTLAANGETGVMKSRLGIRAALQRREYKKSEKERIRKLREAADREHSEASDAARADEILQRLHANGPTSLTDEERAILGRVSEAIRRERERNQDGG